MTIGRETPYDVKMVPPYTEDDVHYALKYAAFVLGGDLPPNVTWKHKDRAVNLLLIMQDHAKEIAERIKDEN